MTLSSKQVDYLAVYEFLAAVLGDRTVIVGTPAWRRLPDDSPEKWGAVYWAAVWWALDQDARQAAMSEASKDVAAAADWSTVGRPKPDGYVPREAA